MKIEVECYSGYRGEETPQKLKMGPRHLEITEVVDRWLAPDYRYFKVRTQDEGVFILRRNVESSEWDLTFFTRGGEEVSPAPIQEQRPRLTQIKS